MSPSKKRSGQRWPLQLFVALFIAFPVATAFANPSFRLFPTQKKYPSTSLISTERFTKNNEISGVVEAKRAKLINDKYHLIWSPTFWKKAVASTIIYMIIQLLASKSNLSSSVGKISSCHQSKITAVILPLLSSSCCAVQLIINTLSGFGCAGFNFVLGPVRPFLLPVLMLSTWTLLPQRSLGWTVLSLFLAFLPEIVYIFNLLESIQWNKKKDIISLQNNAVTATLQLAIPTMGCSSCVNKIDTSIRKCESSPSIIQEKSWLTEGPEKGGVAELKIVASSTEEVDKVIQNVVNAVNQAGFECKTESLQIDKQSAPLS